MGGDDLRIGPALFELHGLGDRLAPGSERSTRRALAAVPELETRRRVVDLGCGTGASTLTLAEGLSDEAEIIAVDVHPPYIQRLRGRVRAAGVEGKVVPRVADMRALGIRPASVDLVWAEGSLYTVGFANGCDLCRRLLVPGGVVGFSELAWLVPSPRPAASAYWAEQYPAMRSREEIVDGLADHGYRVLDAFVLPRADWEGYYAALLDRIVVFARRRQDEAARAAIDLTRAEIDTFERFGDDYGYLFVVASYAV